MCSTDTNDDSSGETVSSPVVDVSNNTDTTTEATIPSNNSTAAPTTDPTTAPITEPPHVHSYNAATCTAPKTCSCGATEGNANGHSWKDATCTSPKVCTACGETSGSAANHNYSNGNCSVCGAKDPSYVSEAMVWIPTHGGTKYHSKSSCSKMIDPIQVTKSNAISQGFGPCGKCY